MARQATSRKQLEQVKRIKSAVNPPVKPIPEKTRLTIAILHQCKGCKPDNIAKEVGVSATTVRRIIQYADRMLHEYVTQMAETVVDEESSEFAEAYAMKSEIWDRLSRKEAPIEIAFDLEIALSDLFQVVRLLNRTAAIHPMPIPWGLFRM